MICEYINPFFISVRRTPAEINAPRSKKNKKTVAFFPEMMHNSRNEYNRCKGVANTVKA